MGNPWICWLALLLLALPAVAQRRTAAVVPPPGLVALIDRSSEAGSRLGDEQRSVLAQATRGEAARLLNAPGWSVLSEENTIAILEGMAIDLSHCEGDCELQIARSLQADWLVSQRIVRFDELWTVQVNLFQTASGQLIGSETRDCDSQRELRGSLVGAMRDLCRQHLLPPPPEQTPPPPPVHTRAPDPPARERSPGAARPDLRNRFCLEIGAGQSFFYPRPEPGEETEIFSWGGDLRLAGPARLGDLQLSWWRLRESPDDDDEAPAVHYTLLRAALELTPLHLGPVHGYLRGGYQLLSRAEWPDERLWLYGAGLEFRGQGGLALSGGYEILRPVEEAGWRYSPLEHCTRLEAAWSWSQVGLGCELLLPAAGGGEESLTLRLRFY
jgi:hypothetical protein